MKTKNCNKYDMLVLSFQGIPDIFNIPEKF